MQINSKSKNECSVDLRSTGWKLSVWCMPTEHPLYREVAMSIGFLRVKNIGGRQVFCFSPKPQCCYLLFLLRLLFRL